MMTGTELLQALQTRTTVPGTVSKESLAEAGFPEAVRNHMIDVTTEAGGHRLWFVTSSVSGYEVEYFDGKRPRTAPDFSPPTDAAVARLMELWGKYQDEGAALQSARAIVADAEKLGSPGEGMPTSILPSLVMPSEGATAVRMIVSGSRRYVLVAALVELSEPDR